jgi:hypothetical protein
MILYEVGYGAEAQRGSPLAKFRSVAGVSTFSIILPTGSLLV